MPMPRVHADQAARQAAYRDRQAEARSQELAELRGRIAELEDALTAIRDTAAYYGPRCAQASERQLWERIAVRARRALESR